MASSSEERPGFWSRTTTRVVTVTALVTAVSGLLVAVRQFGQDGNKPAPPPSDRPTTAATTEAITLKSWANEANALCDQRTQGVTDAELQLQQSVAKGDAIGVERAANDESSALLRLAADLRRIPAASGSTSDIDAAIRAAEDLADPVRSLGIDVASGNQSQFTADQATIDTKRREASAKFTALGASAC